MKRTCQYCNSPLFDTDTVCWHCGKQQSPSSQHEPATEKMTTEIIAEDDPEPKLETVGAPLIFFYGGLTAVIILTLLLITRSLGQSPILAARLDDIGGDWVALTAPDKSFSIEIPAKWDWHFQEGRKASSSFNELLENDSRIMLAVMPLGDLVPDIDYLLVAQDNSSLLVVARSERLNRLSPQQAAASLQAQNFDDISIAEARLIQGSGGEHKVSISLVHTDPALQCDQHLVPGPKDTYLVAVCSDADNFDWQQRIFWDALNSFAVQNR